MTSLAFREDLRERIGSHLADIADMSTEPVRISIIIRNPAHPDGSRDVFLSDDDTEAAIAAIRQVQRVGELTPAVKR